VHHLLRFAKERTCAFLRFHPVAADDVVGDLVPVAEPHRGGVATTNREAANLVERHSRLGEAARVRKDGAEVRVCARKLAEVAGRRSNLHARLEVGNRCREIRIGKEPAGAPQRRQVLRAQVVAPELLREPQALERVLDGRLVLAEEVLEPSKLAEHRRPYLRVALVANHFLRARERRLAPFAVAVPPPRLGEREVRLGGAGRIARVYEGGSCLFEDVEAARVEQHVQRQAVLQQCARTIRIGLARERLGFVEELRGGRERIQRKRACSRRPEGGTRAEREVARIPARGP
jgi:hypothetical protein